MDIPHNLKVKLKFNAAEFVKNGTSYCRCGRRDYAQDLLVLRLIQKYIKYSTKHFFYYSASTSIKYRNVPIEFSSVLEDIANAVCTLLPYANAHKHVDENGMHLILRLPYVRGVFYEKKPRVYKYQHKQYAVGSIL